MKVYLIYYQWRNTKNNHSGMAYLAKKVSSKFNQVSSIKMISTKRKYLRSINLLYVLFLSVFFKFKLKKNDTVILMEYMGRGSFHNIFARISKFINAKHDTVGLVHLSGNHLSQLYSKNKLVKNLNVPDKLITFGTTLSDFIKNVNPQINVLTTFHYVDTEFYVPIKEKKHNERLEVICMGNIKRNFEQLAKLTESLPEIHFNICQGMRDLSHLFNKHKNVTLYDYLEEFELLKLMQKSDISLSIMEDTIGSNVITTSLACGLVQVVSDVGSIRNYCSDKNTLFCQNNAEFKTSIQKLNNDRKLLNQMSSNAVETSKNISLDEFYDFFSKTFLSK